VLLQNKKKYVRYESTFSGKRFAIVGRRRDCDARPLISTFFIVKKVVSAKMA
jgi:hypothetical protein